MANIVWTKHDIDNRAIAFESTRCPYIVPQFRELWYTNGLKFDRFLPTLSILLHPQSIAHPLSGINVAPHSDSKRHGVFLQLRFEASNGNAIAFGGLKCQYMVIVASLFNQLLITIIIVNNYFHLVIYVQFSWSLTHRWFRQFRTNWIFASISWHISKQNRSCRFTTNRQCDGAIRLLQSHASLQAYIVIDTSESHRVDSETSQSRNSHQEISGYRRRWPRSLSWCTRGGSVVRCRRSDQLGPAGNARRVGDRKCWFE